MKKILLETSFSKIYMIVMIIITLLILGGYFSYAMFTVSKEKGNAISIVTGNLNYKLLIDGKEGTTLTVPSNSRKDFVITLTNPNNRIARFNFYYNGDLPGGVDIGYIEKSDYNTPPVEGGINLEKVDSSGSSNVYIVRLANTTDKEISIDLGVQVGLDYNDLTLPDNAHLLRKITSTGTVSEVIEDDIMSRLNYEDTEQTFVTGSNPYNYIWYSGKLWRVVSIDPSDNSVKLVTKWNISVISYNNDSSAFDGSYMEDWLNDTSVDGFLYNLRSPENFIKMDSKWNATEMSNVSKPPSEEDDGTIVEDAVGLLNAYEYQRSYDGTTDRNGYLGNALNWWTLTPYNSSMIYYITHNDTMNSIQYSNAYYGVRPSINLKPEIKIISGDGSEDNPYRLMGDNDTNLEGVKLNTRYSGEYLTFGIGENSLYRIVSHETEGLTKITSADSLKENNSFKTLSFGDSVYYSSANTIGSFLNGEYLTNHVGNNYSNMIEDNTTWYIGTVGSGTSYKLSKYTNTTSNITTSNVAVAKVGLLRYGELLAGQFDRYNVKGTYWLLTLYDLSHIRCVNYNWMANQYVSTMLLGINPSMNLKSNVIITSGDGTKNNPFTLALQ